MVFSFRLPSPRRTTRHGTGQAEDGASIAAVRTLLPIAILAALLASGCGGDDEAEDAAPATTAATTQTDDDGASGCRDAEQPEPRPEGR